MNTRLSDEDKRYIKKCKDKIVYSEDGTRLLKVRTIGEYVEVRPGTLIICDEAFKGNEYVHDAILPESIEQIGRRAFENCKSLFAVNIPAKITSIEPHCFEGCENLTMIEFPNGLTHIEDSAFSGCKSLSKISFPSSLLWIEKLAFCNSGLKELYIDDNTKCGIRERAFTSCDSLEKVTFGRNVIIKPGQDHPSFTFANCMALKGFEVKNINTVYDADVSKSMFRGCMNLERIILPYSEFGYPDFNTEQDEYGYDVRDFNSLIVANQNN